MIAALRRRDRPAAALGAAALLSIFGAGCDFDSTVQAETRDVTVRMIDPAPVEASCLDRSRGVVWLLRQCAFCEFFGYVRAAMPADAERSADGAACLYSAEVPILHIISNDIERWDVLAADEAGWVTECRPIFVEEELDAFGSVEDFQVTGELVFVRGEQGCEVEPIGG